MYIGFFYYIYVLILTKKTYHMAKKTDQEISSEQYVDQMNLIIEYLENNIKYMEKEIEIKQRMLQVDKDSLVHEKQALAKYLSKSK